MEMSVGAWVRVWARTLVLAPVATMILVMAAALIARAINDPASVTSSNNLMVVLAALPELTFYTLSLGAIAGLPTLVFGVPMALVLERLQTTTYLTYALTGLVVGAAAGFVLIWAYQFKMPALDFNVARTIVPVTALYGLIASVAFRTLSRRKLARPRKREPEPETKDEPDPDDD